MPADEAHQRAEHFLTLIRQRQRGRLKLYLGFAAGVGKTYEMLQEGHRLKRQNVDVVIGVVETHGRAETMALVSNVEQVPRRRIEYRGVVLEELDCDAVLTRRPTVALIDELAHSNAPGSRHAKRYQDVEELLRAGINVIATLNIQHLESLYDVIERDMGVPVKERIPDYVLGLADEIVNVDLPAEDLRERLLAGKIYPQGRVNQALENFFTADNLTRLREMTLGEIAHALDRRRREQSGATQRLGSDRLMVCLGSRGPSPESLLRKAARIADRLYAPWYAIYIQTPRESIERIDAAAQRRVENVLELARQLGGVVWKPKGTDVVSTIATFAEEYAITHIVLGRTQRPWYLRIFSQSILDRLMQTIRGITVIIVDTT
ncbi:MAG TPA: universal stress protein [Pirellulales bacterium]|jgi:two-component system sensor histidine kinase KdpD|nr:universal stress protein [Pirellulales bacterium]